MPLRYALNWKKKKKKKIVRPRFDSHLGQLEFSTPCDMSTQNKLMFKLMNKKIITNHGLLIGIHVGPDTEIDIMFQLKSVNIFFSISLNICFWFLRAISMRWLF